MNCSGTTSTIAFSTAGISYFIPGVGVLSDSPAADSILYRIRRRCTIMDPTMRSTPHSGHGIYRHNIIQYEYPTPMHFSPMVSSDIPAHNTPVWHVIVRELVMLAARPYFLKRPTRTFIACCNQYDLCEMTMPLLA